MAEAYTGNTFYHIEGNSDKHGEMPFDNLCHHESAAGETHRNPEADRLPTEGTIPLNVGKTTVKYNIAGENIDPGTPL